MFKVYHADKHGKTLLVMKASYDEAAAYVVKAYKGRFMNDRDRVEIHNHEDQALISWGVDYGMSLEPVKKWKSDPRESRSGATYITQLNSNGIMSCQCSGWVFKKKNKARICKHIKDIAADEGYSLVEQGQYFFVDDKRLKAAKNRWGGASTPEQKFALLVKEYEAVIARMAQLDPADMWELAEEVQVAKFKVEAYMTQLETLGIDGTSAWEQAQAKLGTVLS